MQHDYKLQNEKTMHCFKSKENKARAFFSTHSLASIELKKHSEHCMKDMQTHGTRFCAWYYGFCFCSLVPKFKKSNLHYTRGITRGIADAQYRRVFFFQQFGELTTAVKMPETSNKAKGSKSNSLEKIVQLTQRQLEDLVETVVSKATKPLEEKVNKLELELNQQRKSQDFISKKHDDLT